MIAISYLGMGTAATVEAVCVFSFIGGTANGIEVFATMTAVQERTAAEQQARVGGLTEAILHGGMGVGFLVGGVLAAVASPRAVYVIAGLGILLAAIWRALRCVPRLVPRLASAS